jgi:hypothetical protein
MVFSMIRQARFQECNSFFQDADIAGEKSKGSKSCFIPLYIPGLATRILRARASLIGTWLSYFIASLAAWTGPVTLGQSTPVVTQRFFDSLFASSSCISCKLTQCATCDLLRSKYRRTYRLAWEHDLKIGLHRYGMSLALEQRSEYSVWSQIRNASC